MATSGASSSVSTWRATAEYHDTSVIDPFHVVSSPIDPSLYAVTAPIVDSLQLLSMTQGEPVVLHADNVRPSVDGTMAGAMQCVVPWDNLELTGPEGACLLADAAIGLAVMGSSMIPVEAVGPNADLTLRFTTAPAARVLTVVAAMLSVQHGTATVSLEVHAGDQQLAHGLATSLLPLR